VRRIAIMNEVLSILAGPAVGDAAGSIARLAANVPSYQLWIGEGADLGGVIRETVLPALLAAGESRKRVHA
jgi:hypothetical protein